MNNIALRAGAQSANNTHMVFAICLKDTGMTIRGLMLLYGKEAGTKNKR